MSLINCWHDKLKIHTNVYTSITYLYVNNLAALQSAAELVHIIHYSQISLEAFYMMTIFICIVQCSTYFKAIKNQLKMIFCFQYHPETILPSLSSKGLSNNTYLRSVRVHLQFCPLSKLEMDLDWPVIPFHCTFSTNFSPHWCDIGTYHDSWIVRTRHGNSYIKIQTIFALFSIWIPHFSSWKSWEHHVNNLNTGIGPAEGFFGPRPTKKNGGRERRDFLSSLERCGHNNKDLKIWGSMATAIGI